MRIYQKGRTLKIFNKKKYSYQQFFAPKTIPLENECKEFLKHIKSTKKNYVNTQKSIDAFI